MSTFMNIILILANSQTLYHIALTINIVYKIYNKKNKTNLFRENVNKSLSWITIRVTLFCRICKFIYAKLHKIDVTPIVSCQFVAMRTAWIWINNT